MRVYILYTALKRLRMEKLGEYKRLITMAKVLRGPQMEQTQVLFFIGLESFLSLMYVD